MERVAVLGTGIMGVPMARNLLRAGNDGAPSRQFDRAFELDHGDEDISAVHYASATGAGARS